MRQLQERRKIADWLRYQSALRAQKVKEKNHKKTKEKKNKI